MRCYFCLNEREPSDEHVFPLALGGTLHCFRVCEPCNSRLGTEVDTHLIDFLPCQIKRAQFGLKSNKGNIPDPLIGMMGNAVLADDPTRRMSLQSDGAGGYMLKHMYHAEETVAEDGTKKKTITIDASKPDEVIKIIDRERKRAKVKPLTEEERAAIRAQLPSAVQTIERPWIKGQVQLDLAEFQRGLIKIAYELACMWLGDAYLDCASAGRLRALMDAPRSELLKADLMRLSSGQHPRTQGWAESEDAHVAGAYLEAGNVLLFIKIFDCFSAAFIVAAPSDRVIPIKWPGAFVSNDPVTGSLVESTFGDAIRERINRGKNKLKV